MSNSYFQFRRFRIQQDRCAMKVGTDGTLLGAWARGGSRILDIGTGTGVVALMMAQRFPEAVVTGLDIDEAAVGQARENVACSPFADRVSVLHGDVRTCGLGGDTARSIGSDNSLGDFNGTALAPGGFDAVVCNPPFFVDALPSPDDRRTLARHAASLPYSGLMAAAWRLMAADGELSVVIPFDCRSRLEAEAVLAGFSVSRVCAVKTTPRKPPRRYLIAFRKKPVARVDSAVGILEDAPGVRSAWYTELTKTFYL